MIPYMGGVRSVSARRKYKSSNLVPGNGFMEGLPSTACSAQAPGPRPPGRREADAAEDWPRLCKKVNAVASTFRLAKTPRHFR